jgi:hypothetical protein
MVVIQHGLVVILVLVLLLLQVAVAAVADPTTVLQAVL